jgi:16S rRNA (guanine527-N7)-methyltransferase
MVRNSVDSHFIDRLRRGLKQLGEDPDAHPCEQYLAYIDLLIQWNRAYNLTAVRGREDMLARHILDSLAVLPAIAGRYCMDAGTGAGLPGFLLALARPVQHWTLVDSNMKKIRFLNQAVVQLQPANVEIVHARVEHYQPRRRFDTIVMRACASLKKFHEQTAGLLTDNGRLVAMKGRRPDQELAELADNGIDFQIVEVHVPVLDVIRHLIVMGT